MLGFILVVGNQTTISSRRPSTEVTTVLAGSSHGWGGKSKVEDSDIQDGRLSVFIHKREEQSSHEVIQPLLRYLLFLTEHFFCRVFSHFYVGADVSDKSTPHRSVLRLLPRQSLLPQVHIHTVHPPPLRSSFPRPPLHTTHPHNFPHIFILVTCPYHFNLLLVQSL